MTTHQTALEFHFEPNWDCLEQLLRVYADLDAMKCRRTIDLSVGADYFSTLPGYPNRVRNAYLTLEYAVQQMNRSYYCGNSLVDCVVKSPGCPRE